MYCRYILTVSKGKEERKRRRDFIMAKRDYQVVSEITWSDESTSTLKQSYSSLEKAQDEFQYGLNSKVTKKTMKIIYKPTGEVLEERTY